MNKILQKIINIIHRDRFVGEKKAKGLGRVVEGRTVTRKQVTAPTSPPRPRPDLLLERDYPRIPVAKLQVATYFDRDVEKVPRPYVKLQWNQYRGNGFILYRIERSLDGKTWETLTEIYDQERVEYYDSKVKVETSYYYRLWVVAQVAKGCSRVKRAYVRRDDWYGLVKQECLTTDFAVKKVVDDSGNAVIEGGYIKKGVTLKSFEGDIIKSFGISDILNMTFEDFDGDGEADGWVVFQTANAGLSFVDEGVYRIAQATFPVGSSAEYVRLMYDMKLPQWKSLATQGKIVGFFYSMSADALNPSEVWVNLRVEYYDSSDNLVDESTVQLLYLQNKGSDSGYKMVWVTIPLVELGVEYIKFGVEIKANVDALATKDLVFKLSQFFVAEALRGDVLPYMGDVDLRNHKITNVLDPTDIQDVATKGYVDTKDPQLKVYDSSTRPTCNASNAGMMILYNYSDVNNDYQDIQVCMGDDTNGYGWETIYTKTWPKE